MSGLAMRGKDSIGAGPGQAGCGIVRYGWLMRGVARKYIMAGCAEGWRGAAGSCAAGLGAVRRGTARKRPRRKSGPKTTGGTYETVRNQAHYRTGDG